jgi:hypothetical protein
MPKFEDQLVVRIAAPLREELEREAQADDRPLSAYVRKILVAHAVARVTERTAAGMV